MPGLGCHHTAHPGRGIYRSPGPGRPAPALLPAHPRTMAHPAARDSLQAVALGPGAVHIAAQGTVEVLQGFFFHLHLPLGHKDVLARGAAQSAAVGRAGHG